MLRSVEYSSLRVLRRLGLFFAVRDSRWRSRRLLILCYHGISLDDEHNWDPALYMAPSVFEQRLRLLKEGEYTVLRLSEAIQQLYSNSLPKKSVVITFDDGTYDFYEKPQPLLQKYGFPASVYLTTYYSDNNLPVFRLICSYMLWKKRGTVVDGDGIPGIEKRMDLRTTAGRNDVINSLVSYTELKKMSANEKNNLAEILAERLGFDFTDIRSKRTLHIMSPDEVAELSAAGVDFQLHTHRHRFSLNKALFEKEIRENRTRIQDMTGESPVHFCYPRGKTAPELLPWLCEQNIVSATTCEPGLASWQTNAFLLPRLVDRSRLTPIEFEAWLTGVRSFLPLRRRRSWNSASHTPPRGR